MRIYSYLCGMDIKKLKFLIGTLINTKYGYGTLVGIDDAQVFQMKMAKNVPMFLEEADLMLTNDDYKRASLQHRVIQLTELRKNHCKLVDEAKKQRELAQEHEKTQILNLKNTETSLAKLKESMNGCTSVGKCYKSSAYNTENAIYYRIDTAALKCLCIDWQCEKSPVIKTCKLTHYEISNMTEMNPEIFKEKKIHATRLLGL